MTSSPINILLGTGILDPHGATTISYRRRTITLDSCKGLAIPFEAISKRAPVRRRVTIQHKATINPGTIAQLPVYYKDLPRRNQGGKRKFMFTASRPAWRAGCSSVNRDPKDDRPSSTQRRNRPYSAAAIPRLEALGTTPHTSGTRIRERRACFMDSASTNRGIWEQLGDGGIGR